MPVHFSVSEPVKHHNELQTKLQNEWTHQNTGDGAPTIILEGGTIEQPRHVYVVWQAWSDVDSAARSRIIMEAAKSVLQGTNWLSITLAMGLTPMEAKEIGIKS